MHWESFIDFEVLDEQSAKILISHDYWLDSWKPKKFVVDISVVHITQLRKEILRKKSVKKSVCKDNIISIQAMSRLAKWLKIKGIPHHNWSSNLFRSVG